MSVWGGHQLGPRKIVASRGRGALLVLWQLTGSLVGKHGENRDGSRGLLTKREKKEASSLRKASEGKHRGSTDPAPGREPAAQQLPPSSGALSPLQAGLPQRRVSPPTTSDPSTPHASGWTAPMGSLSLGITAIPGG